MLSLASKPKFYILNVLRAFSLLSLLFVFIANLVILAEDVRALRQPVDKDHEDCEYIEGTSVPNQPAGNFRAFLSIALNLVEVVILVLAEIGFPESFFKNWIPCLDKEHSLVGVGVLEFLLAAHFASQFLDTFPLVASFFLLIAGILNISTMYFDRPKFFRSYTFWKGSRSTNDMSTVESGASRTMSPYNGPSAAPSIFTEKEHSSPVQGVYGFARQDEPVLSRPLSPPNYSPPKAPVRIMTKGGGRIY
ncbi:hypothetical protein FRC14_004093 [Serendipita sp. 396]|nr:hypothetical protein FRC14_004093 [Serendipita sp. 396]KAG8788174.1 hypothetical protein FRC15_005613 [Serendipita sp. 397]KAG8821308.1 hypothetical protein FRC19_008002 [Serendipita sp. 401]KAG8834625.1 hypothetical protein FRC18_001730 [Serendipita sp. 400]KAG8861040.1 hypothetical protein FRB91_011076 [Serendipita sp. 411]KAG8874218.1 hypothetical protein FRC20_006424 [Serendipita sp. 405]KAG9056304.1 hypothetical protein FS842_011051 [Serendipita sp. 407]